MRAYCEKQQNDAIVKIHQQITSGLGTTEDGRMIIGGCRLKWNHDWSMIEYCIDQQVKALRQLGR